MIVTFYTLNNTVSFDNPSLSACPTAAFNVRLGFLEEKPTDEAESESELD